MPKLKIIKTLNNRHKNNEVNFKSMLFEVLIYAPGVVFPGGVSVLMLMILTRYLSPEEYGSYTIIITTVGILSNMYSQWISQSVQRYRPVYRATGSITDFDSNLLFTVLLSMACSLVVALLVYVGLEHNSLIFFTGVLLAISQGTYSILTSVLQSDRRRLVFSLMQIINYTLQLLFAILWLKYISRTSYGLIIAGVLGFSLTAIPLLWISGVLNKRPKLNWQKSMKPFVATFGSYGMPLMGWFIITTVLNQGDRYVLALYRDSTEVGIYSANYSLVSSGLGLISSVLLTAGNPIIMSMTSARNTESDWMIRKAIKDFSRIFIVIVLPISLYLIIYRNSITGLLLGKQFRIGTSIIPVLSIGFLAWKLAMFGHKGLELTDRTKTLFLYITVSAGVNMVLNFILIPFYGYMGASVATLIGFLVYPCLVFISSKRSNIPWELPWLSFFRCAFSSLVAIELSSGVIGDFKHPSGALLSVSVCIPTYLLMLYIVGELKNNNKQQNVHEAY